MLLGFIFPRLMRLLREKISGLCFLTKTQRNVFLFFAEEAFIFSTYDSFERNYCAVPVFPCSTPLT